MRHVVFGALLLASLRVAYAAPPPDADPKLAPWFNSLHMPSTQVPCCSMADCRTVMSRVVDGHYQAFIAGEWREVPDDRVLTRSDNPTGHAVVCWTPFAGVLCLIKAPES